MFSSRSARWPGRAQGLHRIVGHVRPLHEFIQNVKQPGAVGLEQLLLHDVHIVEEGGVAAQVPLGVGHEFRILLLEDVHHPVQVLPVQVAPGLVLFHHVFAHVGHLGDVLLLRQNQIRPFHKGADGFLAQAVFLLDLPVKKRLGQVAPAVAAARRTGKGEIAPVVEKAIVIAVQVFPVPVLGGQLAVHGVESGNVFALIVVQHIRQTHRRLGGPHLNGLQAIAGKKIRGLVARN